MEPKVTVILPVYNTEEFLPECLDSLLAQTLQDFEIICVDDGSTDGSLALLQSYAAKDPRITVLTQQNQYAGVARNHGMRHAKGKYLIFWDSDDFFPPEALEKACRHAEQFQAEVLVFSLIEYDNATGLASPHIKAIWGDLPPIEGAFSHRDISGNFFAAFRSSAANKMFLRSFIEDNGFQFLPLQRTNDQYFSFMSLAKAERIVVLEEGLFYYRTNQTANSTATRHLAPICFVDSLLAVEQGLKDIGAYGELEQSFANFTLSSTLRHLRTPTDWESFQIIYNALRTRILPGLRLEERGAEYFQYVHPASQYEEAKRLMERPLDQYLYEESTALRIKAGEQRKRLVRAKKNGEELQQRYRLEHEKYKDATQKCRNLREQAAGLKEKVTVQQEKVAGLKEKVAGLQGKVTGLQGKVAGLKEQVAGLKKQLAEEQEKRLVNRLWRVANKVRGR